MSKLAFIVASIKLLIKWYLWYKRMRDDGFGDIAQQYMGPLFLETNEYMKQMRDDGVLDMDEYAGAEREVMCAVLPPLKTTIVTANNMKEAIKGHDPILN